MWGVDVDVGVIIPWGVFVWAVSNAQCTSNNDVFRFCNDIHVEREAFNILYPISYNSISHLSNTPS
jgi:hypothetical protein